MDCYNKKYERWGLKSLVLFDILFLCDQYTSMTASETYYLKNNVKKTDNNKVRSISLRQDWGGCGVCPVCARVGGDVWREVVMSDASQGSLEKITWRLIDCRCLCHS